MNLLKNLISNVNVNDKKIVYLIYFLPVSILAGSLLINLTIFFISIFFIIEIVKEKKFKKIFTKTYNKNLAYYYMNKKKGVLLNKYKILNYLYFCVYWKIN